MLHPSHNIHTPVMGDFSDLKREEHEVLCDIVHSLNYDMQEHNAILRFDSSFSSRSLRHMF